MNPRSNIKISIFCQSYTNTKSNNKYYNDLIDHSDKEINAMKSIERIKVRWKIIQIMYLIKVLENMDIDIDIDTC